MELERLHAQRAEVSERLELLRQQLLLTELRDIDETIERAKDLRRRSADKPDQPVTLSSPIAEDIRTRLDRLGDVETEVAERDEATRAAAPEVRDLEHDRHETGTALDGLRAYMETDESQEDLVRDALARLDAPSDGEPQPRLPRRDPELERYRDERSKLRQLETATARMVWSPARLALATLLAVASICAAITVHSAGFTGLLFAAAVVALARRPSANPPELTAVCERYGVTSLDELDGRAAEEDRKVAEAEGVHREWMRQQRDTQKQRSDAEHGLRGALEAAKAPAGRDLGERAAAYLAACDKRREAVALDGRLGTLEARLIMAREPARDLDKLRREQRSLQEDLSSAYGELGIDASDLDRAGHQFKKLARQADADARRVASAEKAEEALAALLAGRTVDELERRRDTLERRHREHVALHGERVSVPGSVDALSADLEGKRQELADLDIEIADRDGRLTDREGRVADPAELRERIAELEKSILDAEGARDAIRIAREQLHEAAREAHQEFVPHLNEALRANLERVTGGRYRDAAVDDELRVSVRVPETGKLVPADELSRGTQDQIFLVERLEIAELLDPTTGDAPLLLDDPFAHFDSTRLQYGLEVVRDASINRQVILFSEDRDLVELAQQVCEGCAVIELPGPGYPVSPEASALTNGNTAAVPARSA